MPFFSVVLPRLFIDKNKVPLSWSSQEAFVMSVVMGKAVAVALLSLRRHASTFRLMESTCVPQDYRL